MASKASRRLIVIAAHLALLLAVCSPVVSQLLAAPGMSGHDMAGMAMPMPAVGHHHQGSHHEPDGQAPTDACGYCSLFAHLPFTAAVAAMLATLPPLPAPRFPVAEAPAVRQVLVHGFRPRGPPSVIVPA